MWLYLARYKIPGLQLTISNKSDIPASPSDEPKNSKPPGFKVPCILRKMSRFKSAVK